MPQQSLSHSMVHPTIIAPDIPASPKSPILNDDKDNNRAEKAPPATILMSPAPATPALDEGSARGTPTTPQELGGVGAVAVDIMPPILSVPPESSAAGDDCCGTDMSLPASADGEQEEEGGEEPGKEEPGRSGRDSSSGTADSGNAAATAKYGQAQSSMPRNFRLSLDGYVLQSDKDGKYAAYRISVTAGLHTWVVLRR